MAESDQETDSCTEEEEVEPKLKYKRLLNDLQNILLEDAVSCIKVHTKFLFLGTHWGAIHLLDHQGNNIGKEMNFQRHMVSVNEISVDSKAEFIATCSDDGLVIIKGLYSNDNNQKLNLGQNVKCVGLDPVYYKPGSGRKFIIGDKNLTLYEKTFLKNLKPSLLSSAEGNVMSISWCGQWIAWASHVGVRLYDLNEKVSLGLINWEQPQNATLTEFRCNLRWSTPTTLLIGWCDTIRICVIRKRTITEATGRNIPEYIVVPISTFQTDFYICGLAPLDSNQLVVLGFPKDREPETNKALRPILSVLQYQASDYVEICTDSLSIRGYQLYNCNDYHLDCLLEENQYFIVSPKDIVVASQYDHNDRIEWLLQHEKFEQAMDVISTKEGKVTLISVAQKYLDYLLRKQEYTTAAQLCHKVFGNNKQLWEEEVYKFVKENQLRSISAYIPRTDDCKLNPQVYELVLYEYLQYNKQGFLDTIKEWHPSLYNTSAVIHAILNFLMKDENNNNNILREALAILYTYEKNYENALGMYLKLQHKDVFELIKTHDLYSKIRLQIIPLLKLDSDKAIAMLLEKNKISSDIIVNEIQTHPYYLYLYLDALDKVGRAKNYHEKLVSLYAKFAPEKLLPFLKRSQNYPIQKALDICKDALFYPEMVYLLSRIGNTKEALSIIINKLNDIDLAIEFCKENDDHELWNELINKSLDKSEIMTKLLDGIVGFINPVILINKIETGKKIPGLKNSIIKMLSDYSLQVSIQDGCNQILVTDYFNLHEKLVKNQKKAVSITNDEVCEMCRRDIIIKDSLKTNIIAFNCHHFFHETCLPDSYSTDFCVICNLKQTQK